MRWSCRVKIIVTQLNSSRTNRIASVEYECEVLYE